MKHVQKEGKAGGKAFADTLVVQGFGRDVRDMLATGHAGLLSVVDFASVEPATGGVWHDKIHSAGQGFGQLAIALNAAIRAQFLLSRRAAVA